MTNARITKLLNEALNIYNEIAQIKAGRLGDLENALNSYKATIELEMQKANIKKLEGDLGQVTYVERRGASKLNEVQIAADLGIEDLDKYRIEGKTSTFVKFTPKKDE